MTTTRKARPHAIERQENMANLCRDVRRVIRIAYGSYMPLETAKVRIRLTSAQLRDSNNKGETWQDAYDVVVQAGLQTHLNSPTLTRLVLACHHYAVGVRILETDRDLWPHEGSVTLQFFRPPSYMFGEVESRRSIEQEIQRLDQEMEYRPK